jgi:hypothetical protein
LAAATLGVAGVSGSFAQQEDGVYGGDIPVAPEVTGELSVAPSDTGEVAAPVASDSGEAAVVPEITEELAAPEVPGEVVVPEVTPSILGEGTQVPEVIESSLGAEIPADAPIPVHLTAIFGEDFPFGDEGSPEGVIGEVIGAGGAEEIADDAIAGDITIGGTPGGDAGGTMTLGAGEGDISIGGGESVETAG